MTAKSQTEQMIPSTETLITMLRSMARIRAFEDRVYTALLNGLVPGTTHLCQGQEAVSVGVVSALGEDDYLSYTYRGHGHCIARGMSPAAAFAESFGRENGICKGYGGSMHLTDDEIGLVGSFGIVGAGLPFATGTALSAQLDRNGQISVTFFGDGATNIGAFHEAMNLAAVWDLPLIFVCENNLYGEYSRIDRTTPFEDLYRRADAYDMEGVKVDGNDVLAVYEVALNAVKKAREGDGPTFIECKTYRQGGHSRTDPAKYRADSEVAEWMEKDPIIRFSNELIGRSILDQNQCDDVIKEAQMEMEQASKTAEAHAIPQIDHAAMMAATYA